MERDQTQRRRGRRRSGSATENGATPVRLARVVRAPAAPPAPPVSEASVVIELAGVRVSVGRDADPGVVALVLALLGGAR